MSTSVSNYFLIDSYLLVMGQDREPDMDQLKNWI